MTPYEAWTTEKPTVAHLRVFGSDAYAHIPKDERGKLDPKAKKCIFVGYGEETKGYRLFDPVRGKIFFSRDVVLNEDGSGRSAVEDEDRYVEVELSTDDCPTAQEPPQVEPQAEQVDSDLPTDSAQDESTLPQPVVRRSTRQRHTPDYFGWRANVAKGQVQEAHTVEGVLSTPEKAHWLKAMENEMKSLSSTISSEIKLTHARLLWMESKRGQGSSAGGTHCRGGAEYSRESTLAQSHGERNEISIKYHFIQDQVDKGSVKLQYCPTEDMVADMLTKGLPKEQFAKLRSMAGVISLRRSGCE